MKIKHIVTLFYLIAWFFYDDMTIYLIGSSLVSVLCKILKSMLNHPRPDGGKGRKRTDSGMPSSHAALYWYFTMFPIIKQVLTLQNMQQDDVADAELKLYNSLSPSTILYFAGIVSFGLTAASGMSYIRIHTKHHTFEQVAVGGIVGSLSAIFVVLVTSSPDAFLSSSVDRLVDFIGGISRLQVLLGSSIFFIYLLEPLKGKEYNLVWHFYKSDNKKVDIFIWIVLAIIYLPVLNNIMLPLLSEFKGYVNNHVLWQAYASTFAVLVFIYGIVLNICVKKGYKTWHINNNNVVKVE